MKFTLFLQFQICVPKLVNHIAVTRSIRKENWINYIMSYRGHFITSLTMKMFRSSFLSIEPFPSASYSLKYHFNFCSIFPRTTRFTAAINSKKSINPSYGKQGEKRNKYLRKTIVFNFRRHHLWIGPLVHFNTIHKILT